MDASLEEPISRATRIEEEKKSVREIFASIIVEKPATTTPTAAAARIIPTKSSVSTPRASRMRKGA